MHLASMQHSRFRQVEDSRNGAQPDGFKMQEVKSAIYARAEYNIIKHCQANESSMHMLPFTIKTTNQPTARLCRITPPDRHQELNIDVQFLLYSWEIHRWDALRDSTRRQLALQLLNEAQQYADEVFITFLRGVAETAIFLPTDVLNRYPHCQYYLLLSPNRSRELFEVYNASGRYSRYLVTCGGYDLIVNVRSQLSDMEAYLISPNKYTLFLRQINEPNEIKVYRSDFVDLAENTPPPLDFHAQDVIDTVQRNIEAAMIERELLRPRFSSRFPLSQREEAHATVVKCPKCNSEVRRIGGESYFCLDCDWDNLPTLRGRSMA